MLKKTLWFSLFVPLCATFCAVEFDSCHVISRENAPGALIEGKVSVITGKWHDAERDLVIRGAEPIVISRFFSSGERKEWNFTHLIHVDKIEDYHDDLYQITENTGSRIEYTFSGGKSRIGNKEFKRYIPNNLAQGFTNNGRGSISSRTNLHNNVLFVCPKGKTFILQCANGSVRTYRKIHKGDGMYRILSEHLPNGNWILYDYEEIVRKQGETPIFNLVSIRTTNPSK